MGIYIVTGAAGFIGSQVANALLAQGHQVVGVDNLSAAYDVRMKQHRLQTLLPQPAFTFLKADITDLAIIDKLAQVVPQAQAVINLAAMAGVRQSTSDPWSYLYTNTLGTLNLLEYTRRQAVPKFILASTSSLYGADGTPPHSELAPTDHPLAPYAASKKGAEAFAYSYHHLYGIDISVLRYFTVYGPAGRPDMSMFRFCQWISEGRPVTITGDGEQSRGFTYLDDIAEGTLLALKNVGYDIFNLGGHDVMTINQLVETFEELLGKKANRVYIPAHPADVYSNVADVNKARTLLGWEPRVGLQEGVRNLVDWYLTNRSWAKDIITD
ncbi:MAG: SDR family NAD(P)-dependent oxidoreductase [Anaerolineaceae bacterium]|jgi:nucleoside-diphosphate-sugar epimerase|nr:SDR family NAD(P)-dependent oxidoreductase [Anaerolineaceae bacterium]MDD4043262.1 SDR family NAD(P)-dependent oxidoreductase [Anaerolineaceae bacterium]MDD4578457.1 SDR family NAD(P)-dependent oxidoreductase [Anaerolineaceae bacterium]